MYYSVPILKTLEVSLGICFGSVWGINLLKQENYQETIVVFVNFWSNRIEVFLKKSIKGSLQVAGLPYDYYTGYMMFANSYLCLNFQTSELGVTEHVEGDPCKFALWVGRTPTSDNKIVLKVSGYIL